jgi:hypothetical protein
MIAGDIVNQLVVGQNGWIPALMIPKAIAKPRTFGQGFGELSDALLELGLAVGCAKMHSDQRTAADEEMHVGVVEAGQEKAAAEVDDACVGAGEFSNRCVTADRENPGTIERHCLCGGLLRIFGPYLGIDEDQARVRSRRAAAAGDEHNNERA